MEKNKTFEESLLKLEVIIRELESGEVPLDDMVKKYTEAMELVKFCNQKLANATETVNKILIFTKNCQVNNWQFFLYIIVNTIIRGD